MRTTFLAAWRYRHSFATVPACTDRAMGFIVRAVLSSIVVLAALDLASPAFADGWTIRDAHGRRTETIEDAPGGKLVRRDQSGRRTGTIESAPGDRLILRDDHGRRTGMIERSSNGRYVIRDESGRRTGTAERSAAGNFVLRDAQGRRTGTAERRW